MNNKKLNTQAIILSALLCSIGIIIPLFSPIKIILEPASFTLASHVAIFIAMFVSPGTALFVAIGTTVGFFLGGFPITVVLRALSHVVFVTIGSLYLKKNKRVLNNFKSSIWYSFFIALIHAVSEVLIVIPFYFGSSLSDGYYDKGFVVSILGLVGVGTLIHSMIDFSLSLYIWNMLPKSVTKKILVQT
jgi:niacin transporter